ncbi:MAG: hypothetical protein IJ050_08115, partial [Clostridia bacterium]|nr:hypothetical protein [Clostridia bacterium]
YVNTCLYVGFMQTVMKIAEILGRENEARHLTERTDRVKKAIDIAYFSKQQRAYCGDVQGASCLALQIGNGNEGVHKKVVEKYRRLGMFDTGIIATPALTGWLFDSGEAQLAFDLLTSKGEVSFDYMARNGATTIWENWNGESSKNHPMFGAVTKYLFTRLLGIRQPDDSAGFEKVVISPCLVEGLNYVKGHITTLNGEIGVEIKKQNGKAVIKAYADKRIKAEIVCAGICKAFSDSVEVEIEI